MTTVHRLLLAILAAEVVGVHRLQLKIWLVRRFDCDKLDEQQPAERCSLVA